MAQPIATPDCELDNSRADFLNFLKSIILVFDMTRVHLIQGTTANLIANRENSHTEPDTYLAKSPSKVAQQSRPDRLR